MPVHNYMLSSIKIIKLKFDIEKSLIYNINMVKKICRCGGMGRHKGLKIPG